GRSLLLFGSMNYKEQEIVGIHPDIAFIAAGPARREIYEYSERLMRCLNYPPVVIATHWDDQGLPFGAPQDAALAEAKIFVDELHRYSPNSRVIIPSHFQTITVDAYGKIGINPPSTGGT